jgi:SAM-dependent methyltransferase
VRDGSHKEVNQQRVGTFDSSNYTVVINEKTDILLEPPPKYFAHDRNDRLRPKRSSRVYCHLSQLRDTLEQLIDSDTVPPGDILVDYGCGNKPYEPLFRKKFKRYLGADIAGNPFADLVIGPNGDLPLPDSSVDCVLSSQVLEHVGEPARYLLEAIRVLKPERNLILSTHGIWPYHPDPNDYWRWTIQGLKREAELCGFEVLSVNSVLRIESVALQLWQDATFERLPRFLQPAYTFFFQTLIQFIERRSSEQPTNDASVYVVLLSKPKE